MHKQKFILGTLILITSFLSLIYILKVSQNSLNNPTNYQVNSPAISPQKIIEKIVNQRAIEDSSQEETTQSAQLSFENQVQGTSTGVSYSAVTLPLSSTIITDTAGDDDCSNNCPTKPLAQYVKDNGAAAGMNGTYFCPPDYSWCSGKVNSYDFPVWNNRKKKWMQSSKLFWSGRGMMVFRPGSAQFFPNAAAVGAPSDITGGIVNYPSLLSGGKYILDEGSLPASMLTTKGTRSGIGFGNGKVFMVVARRANMKDLAGIFISLGASDALNLDGGGSAALYQGKYKAGPGRSLPNAIIVK